MNGWLVNDCLTCIPGTKTFWHDLLEWIPRLTDKTGGHTAFGNLASKIEKESLLDPPDYIIRNATFFRKLDLLCKQISFLQDHYEGDTQQIDVCNNSTITVFNSNYTYQKYKDKINSKLSVIPIGTDFKLFNRINDIHPEVLPNSILFVGASTDNPKGFHIIRDLINRTSYNFCLVMKDAFTIEHPRVRVFNRIDHNTLVRIYNSCEMLLCTSVTETLHLVSVEAGACGLPIITTDVGILHGMPSGIWGLKVENSNYVECIEYVKNHKEKFFPRQFLLDQKFDKDSCKERWVTLINELANY